MAISNEKLSSVVNVLCNLIQHKPLFITLKSSAVFGSTHYDNNGSSFKLLIHDSSQT